MFPTFEHKEMPDSPGHWIAIDDKGLTASMFIEGYEVKGEHVHIKWGNDTFEWVYSIADFKDSFPEGRWYLLVVPWDQRIPWPDWSTAPFQAEWWCLGPDRWGMWSELEPKLMTTANFAAWNAREDENGVQHWEHWDKEYELPLGVDWRLMKQKRPVEMNNEERTDS